MEDGETFTTKWKIEILIHPIISKISSPIIRAQKSSSIEGPEEDVDMHSIYEELLDNIVEASKMFHELGFDAFDVARKIQDGLSLTTSMLYQFYPDLEDFHERMETYEKVNEIFWGQYFHYHGVDGAHRVGKTDDLSTWQAAKVFAEEFWKFENGEFGDTINLGMKIVEQKIREYSEPKEKLNLISKLLDRFGYSKDLQNGFMFFLGGSINMPRSENDIETLQTAREQISKFDINEEYEQLFNFQDRYVQNFFEEFIWRLGVDLEPRKIKVPNSNVEVSEFKFKNHHVFEKKNTKIETYFEIEDFLNRMLEGIGTELSSNDYDLRNSYKAGVCFFNLKAQIDNVCTSEILRTVNNSLTPIIDFITMVARTPTKVIDDYLDIQVALLPVMRTHKTDFCHELWAYQSFVFYENQKEIVGITNLSVVEFQEHCRKKAFEYLNVSNPKSLLKIAERREHLTMFPSIHLEINERESFEEAFKDTFGSMKPEGYHGDLHVKCLIIYSYFSVICETTLSSHEKITIQ